MSQTAPFGKHSSCILGTNGVFGKDSESIRHILGAFGKKKLFSIVSERSSNMTNGFRIHLELILNIGSHTECRSNVARIAQIFSARFPHAFHMVPESLTIEPNIKNAFRTLSEFLPNIKNAARSQLEQNECILNTHIKDMIFDDDFFGLVTAIMNANNNREVWRALADIILLLSVLLYHSCRCWRKFPLFGKHSENKRKGNWLFGKHSESKRKGNGPFEKDLTYSERARKGF